MTKDLNSRLIDVSVGEAFEILTPQFSELLKTAVEEAVASAIEPKEVYGIKGIQSLFGKCSQSKAQIIKNSGILDPAITQHGRKIVTNVKLAKQLLKEHSMI